MSRPADSRPSRPERTPGQVWRREFYRRLRVLRNLSAFLLLILLNLLWDRIIHVVPAGHAGVLFRPLQGGVVVNRTFGEGLHITFPWNRLYVYDYRIHEEKLSVPVLAHNGLSVDIDVSARFRPARDQLPLLHREIGSEYIDKIVVPIAISAVREVAGGFQHQQLFHASNSAIEAAFLEEANEEIAGKHISFDEILVRRIQLPEEINQAIRNKLREEERVEEFGFRVKSERLEADRKRVEGKGIQDFQALVQKNLTTRMLYWRGIRATVDLAKSENAKVVVIGSGGDGRTGLGLPIIMGGWDGKAPSLPEEGSQIPSPLTTDAPPLDRDVQTGYQGSIGTTASP